MLTASLRIRSADLEVESAVICISMPTTRSKTLPSCSARGSVPRSGTSAAFGVSGVLVPLDEALAQAVVDVSGRPTASTPESRLGRSMC